MLVHRGGCGAAGFEPLAQALRRLVQPLRRAQAVQHLHAQAFHVADQRVEGLGLARLLAHAQAQVGGKAGGEDLSGAVGDGVQQRGLPLQPLVVRAGQQAHQPVELRLGYRGQPLGVKGRGQCQTEQLRGVQRLGAAGQQLVAQACSHFADHGVARRKAKIGQQGGDVHRLHQHLPPGLQARLQLRARIYRIDEGLHPVKCGRDGRLVSAYPARQLQQPQVALGQACAGVQPGQQLFQLGRCGGQGRIQCSTLAPRGALVGPVPVASSRNSGMGTSNASPSSPTQW